MKTVVSLVGARPQFVKEACVGKAARAAGLWRHVVVHSGQHYDPALSDVFFEELGIPQPDHHLGIGSGSHAAMTAAALIGMEGVLLQEKADALLVYGDTNTTLAGAIAAAKLHIPVIHVEAGIRMLPKTMPEEINRVLTDHIASVFCCCSHYGKTCLEKEGITGHVAVTDDVMYDVFLHMRHRFSAEKACREHRVEPGTFVVVTLHRDYNVDDPHTLSAILDGLAPLAARMPVLFFVHPRTHKSIEDFGLTQKAAALTCAPPASYMELMSLVEACAFVITDSGGLQKEAYFAGKRSIVVMPDTGWRALTECGWNVLAAADAHALQRATYAILHEPCPQVPTQFYGDGNAAGGIIDAIDRFLAGEQCPVPEAQRQRAMQKTVGVISGV